MKDPVFRAKMWVVAFIVAVIVTMVLIGSAQAGIGLD